MKRALLLLAVVLAAAAGGTWLWMRASLPQLDGEIPVAGLAAPVEVLIDGHGVPHVYARGVEDAYFAAGVLHARDRLWQMELYRRAAGGRLSEWLGAATLSIDRRFVTLDLRRAAAEEWAAATEPVREALTRYAQGVNSEIARASGRRRPLELQFLRVTSAEWTPVDSLMVGRLLAWRLAENHQAELVRAALGSRFGAAEADRLAGGYPPAAPTVIQGSVVSGQGLDVGPQASGVGPQANHSITHSNHPITQSPNAITQLPNRPIPQWPPGLSWLAGGPRGGSNNWVIAGRRTASGRPLLANDPHLQLEFPGVWYEMHLVAAGLDVIGVTVPGTPFVIIGHNATVAWGLTNTGADVQDLYLERLDLSRRQYVDGGQWRPVQVERADIPVDGQEGAQPFEVWRTRHGTVFAEPGLDWEDAPAWLSPAAERSGEKRAYALRWDAAGGEMAGAFEALNRAGTWSDFLAAVERFASPSQNFVYADVEGNIGYAMSGVLPQRSSGVGTRPVDGTGGEAEWIDRIPPASLPRLFNPPRGYITSSNNQIDREWPGLITRDWAAPYRASRLTQLMDAGEQVDLARAADWQNDVATLAAADLLTHADAAIAAATVGGTKGAVEVLQQLKAWDKRADNRPVVTLFHLFEDALWRRTFRDEMGDPLFERFYEWAGGERPAGLYALIDDAQSRWFDDIATLERREGRNEIFLLAAADAARIVSESPAGARGWADAHAARFSHPLGGAAAALGWLFDRGPVQVTGDGTTVNRVSYHRLRPFAAYEIPSWRQLFDVGQWDEARVVLPAGQSGHPLSAWYFDQNEMWRTGQYRRQPFSRSAVESSRQHRLLLLPD